MMTHRERIERCLAQLHNDRVPVALWRHFPVDDQSAEGLASACLAFQQTYDFDFVKVTPESSYCLKDWGAVDEWRGSTEGTRAYTHRVIQGPEDWYKLPVLDPTFGHLGKQLACLQIITHELGSETPVIQTIFSPLSQAKNLVGADQLLVHMRQYPDALQAGLKTITASTIRFIEEIMKTGIAGIFYAIQHAQYSLLSEQEYDEFQKVSDMEILEPAKVFWLNILHLHGTNIMFHKFIDYPVNVINWHDRETRPSLSEALDLFPGVVCGGIGQESPLVLGTAKQIRQQARQAIEYTNGNRLILGTGCVTPITAPHGNILAARRSVE